VVLKLLKSGAFALVLFGVLSGCAVDPEPLTQQERTERVDSDVRLIKAMEFVPDGPITLHQAMARAVAFNLQRRVKEIEREIEDAELRTTKYDYLPSLDLDGSRNRSDNELSLSDDRITNTGSAGLTWNVLDLGVSYARARQQSNEVLIARENERKALQDIMRQVRVAYWRAAGAERLMRGVNASAKQITIAMRESRVMERSGANDAIKSVSYRREIVDSIRQALSIQRELREARAELAELLNIQPGTKYTLAPASMASMSPSLPMSLAELEKHALDNRPELRVEDYNERIGEWQAREAFFNMLPSAKLSAGGNYSSDSFNLTPNWISTGFQLGMNLFSLFSGSSKMKEAEARAELARRQRLALTLAVMTQTHMAYIQFRNASQQTRLASEVARADRRLARLIASDTDFVNTDYFEAVRIATRQLQSEMDEHQAQVALVTAHGELMHAVGLDVVPERFDPTDLASLTDQIRAITANWESGRDGDLPPETPLDVLVINMLQNGEAKDFKPELPGARLKGVPSFEVRHELPDIPKSNVEMLAGLNDLATAAGVERAPEQAASLPPEVGTAELPDGEREEEAPEIESAEVEDFKGDGISRPDVAEAGPAGTRRYVVQLGVFKNDELARRFQRALTETEGSGLHGVDVRIEQRPANNGDPLYYVETAPVDEWSTARDLCATLSSLGQKCVPMGQIF